MSQRKKKNLDAVSTAPARSTRCSSLFDKVPSRSREGHLVASAKVQPRDAMDEAGALPAS